MRRSLEAPLLGVPFAVKNLFDIAGIATRAGSKIERDRAAGALSTRRSSARLEQAGAVLVGALNMDEYAYGFTTENSHDGPTRNPHDPRRVAGGSSGGSAAAVAAGQVPISLGSDTNGSIRVPSSLCGVFGLKPTYGRLPRHGTYPFVASLDHLGPFARSRARPRARLRRAAGLRRRAIRPAPARPRRADREHARGAARRACASASCGGWFRDMPTRRRARAVDRVAMALGAQREIELPDVAAARAAAFLISNAEGGALHLPDLRTRAADFEPLSRDRFLAGALLPAAWIVQAQRLRRAFALAVAAVLREVDVLIAPATPCVAPPIGSEWIEVGGRRLPRGRASACSPSRSPSSACRCAPCRCGVAMRRCRSACRSSPRPGARTSSCAWPIISSRPASLPRRLPIDRQR